jgi:DNA-binding LacI/PurR family transcriptional regulator
VEVLLRMINREPAELPLELLRPELVIRESTAMPDAT